LSLESLESSSHVARNIAGNNARLQLNDEHAATVAAWQVERFELNQALAADLLAVDARLASVEAELNAELLGEVRRLLGPWARKWRAQPTRELTAQLAEHVAVLGERSKHDLGLEFDARNLVIAFANEIISARPLAIGPLSLELLTSQVCETACRVIKMLGSAVDVERLLLELEAGLEALTKSRASASPVDLERWAVVCSEPTEARRRAAMVAFTEREVAATNARQAAEHEARIAEFGAAKYANRFVHASS